MAELAYREVHRLVIERTTLDAKERLQNFMQDSASLIDKVPQYHIASYLGITAQSLSKLKRELKDPQS
jgi:CRP-like cAMP-binding protein